MSPVRTIRGWWRRTVPPPPPGWEDRLDELADLKVESKAALKRNRRKRAANRSSRPVRDWDSSW